MFNLSIEKFFEILNEGNDIIVVANNKKIIVESSIEINFDDLTENNEPKTTNAGYLIDGKKFKNESALKKELDKYGIIDCVDIEKLDEFYSYEEYLENIEFQKADMNYLLEKYGDCDSFTLCAYYGENKISKDYAQKALNELIEDNRNYLQNSYEQFKNKYNLPPFNEIERNIEIECLEFDKKYRSKYMKKNGFFENSFICDKVGENTKYGEPIDYFWHFYHMKGNELDVKELLNNLTEKEEEFTPLSILNKKEYLPIKNLLLDYKITFSTHCTIGPLQIEYKFKLNDEDKKWLLTHKNDYDFNGELQDLAFSKGDKIRFSSCTHERFHDDIK